MWVSLYLDTSWVTGFKLEGTTAMAVVTVCPEHTEF